MINTDLYLAAECLGNMVLVTVTPDYYGETKEKHAEAQGFKYEVMLPAHRYDKLTVKIAGAQQLEPPISGHEPQVEFRTLRVHPYVDRTGRMAYTASAAAVKVVLWRIIIGLKTDRTAG